MCFLGLYIIFILLNFMTTLGSIDMASIFIDNENEAKCLKHLSSW